MSDSCSYCGRSGHHVQTCSKRQEDYFGTPDDPSETMADRVEDDARTDGGVPDLRSHLDDALERARETGADLATLAFAGEYVPAVRAGDKTVTLRRPGAYDVAVRHAAAQDTEIVLVDGQGEPFARAAIDAVWKVDAEAVATARLAGYPDVACADDVVRILERHYELEIGGDAEHVRVHAIHFDVTELLRPAVLEGGEGE